MLTKQWCMPLDQRPATAYTGLSALQGKLKKDDKGSLGVVMIVLIFLISVHEPLANITKLDVG